MKSELIANQSFHNSRDVPFALITFACSQDISSTERSAMSDLQSLFNHMFSKDVIENDSFLQSCISPAMTIPLSVILEVTTIILYDIVIKYCLHFSPVAKSAERHN